MDLNVLSLKTVTENYIEGNPDDESSNWYNKSKVLGTVGEQMRKYSRFAQENQDEQTFGYLLRINIVEEEPLKLTYYCGSHEELFYIPDKPARDSISFGNVTYNSVFVNVTKPLSTITGCQFEIVDSSAEAILIRQTFSSEESEKEFELDDLKPFSKYTIRSICYLTQVGKSEKLELNKQFITSPSSPPSDVVIEEASFNHVQLSWTCPISIGAPLTASDLTYKIQTHGRCFRKYTNRILDYKFIF
jgi:hypothetical protein